MKKTNFKNLMLQSLQVRTGSLEESQLQFPQKLDLICAPDGPMVILSGDQNRTYMWRKGVERVHTQTFYM